MSAIVVLIATADAFGPAPRPAAYGLWTATAGATVFHGKWSAQALPAAPDSVIGSWALLSDGGEVTLQGAWTAKKLGKGWASGWRGTWQAKVQPTGGSLTGTWQAVPPSDFHGRTFEELLRATDHPQLSGSWNSRGGAAGAWWLKPQPS